MEAGFNCINEPHATAKYLPVNCPIQIEKVKQHATGTDHEAKVKAARACKKKQEKQDRDETLQKLFTKLDYMGSREKLPVASRLKYLPVDACLHEEPRA